MSFPNDRTITWLTGHVVGGVDSDNVWKNNSKGTQDRGGVRKCRKYLPDLGVAAADLGDIHPSDALELDRFRSVVAESSEERLSCRSASQRAQGRI